MRVQQIIDQFPSKVLSIFNYTAEYGIENSQIDIQNIAQATEEEKIEFQTAVHKGFRLGQSEILKEMTSCYILLKEQNNLLKEARRNNQEANIKQLRSKIETIEYMVKVFRHFADFIVWQVVKGNHHHIRAMYSGSKARPSILNSNIESVITLVNEHHKSDPTCFALISDLTSFLDIGDVLLIKKDKFILIEVKQGAVQKKVFEFIDSVSNENFQVEEYNYSGLNDKFFDQVERTLRQFKKGAEYKRKMNTTSEIFPIQENNKAMKPFDQTNRYYSKLVEALENSKKNGVDMQTIEEIICICAITKKHEATYGQTVMEGFVKKHFKNQVKIYQFEEMFDLPVVEPIFFKPIGREWIFQLLFRQISIQMVIDLDALIQLFNQNNIETKWTSTKESHKQSEKKSDISNIFRKDKRSIKLKIMNEWIYLTEYTIQRMIFDNVLPTTIIN